MIRFKASIKDLSGVRAGLKSLQGKCDNPIVSLKNIGLYMLGKITKRFDQQGPGWKPSGRVIMSGGKTLSQSRRLLNSHTFTIIKNTIVIGTNLIYARIHQLGGIIKAKNSTGYLMFKYKGIIKGARGVKIGYTWARVKQVTIPARPWLFFDNEDIQICRKIIIDNLQVLK